MQIKFHYFEILELLGELFAFMFNGIKQNFQKELELIYKQYPYIDSFQWSEKTIMIPFKEGLQILRSAGVE